MLAGEREFSQVTAGVVRLPVIGLSLLTLVLAYLLGRRLLGRWPALTGAALFALAPGAILGSRQVESEALLAPMLLLVLLLAHRIVEDEAGRLDTALLLATCALAPLVKVPGAGLGAIAAVVLAVCGRRRLAGVALAMSALGLLGFAAYGFLIDWGQFLAATQAQAARHSGLLSGFTFITAPAGFADVEPLRDGWWLLGWIGIGLLGATGDRRRQLLLVWPPAAYAATMLVLAREQSVEQYGWYRQIVYPEVYLGAAFLAMEAVRRRSVGLLTLLLVLGGATATEWWLAGPDYAWVPGAVSLVLLILAVLGPAVLSTWRRRDSELRLFARGLAALALALMLLGNAVESFWLDRVFTRL
jgi:4-amino-4-deoxy-L-arabinose transferase-like glycosyltransferase